MHEASWTDETIRRERKVGISPMLLLGERAQRSKRSPTVHRARAIDSKRTIQTYKYTRTIQLERPSAFLSRPQQTLLLIVKKMSGPSSSVSGASSSVHTPLSEVVRRCWDEKSNNQEGETILVMDSLESDGRFVLGTLVSSVLQQETSAATRGTKGKKDTTGSPRVLWLNCTTMTEQLTLSALKKIGCPKSATSTANLPDARSSTTTISASVSAGLTIRSIPALLRHKILTAKKDRSGDRSDAVNADEDGVGMEAFVKMLYREVKSWTANNETEKCRKDRRWVVLDDASTLAVLVGEPLAYGLILSLQALSRSSLDHAFGFVIRAANDTDVEVAALLEPRSTQWFGGGSGIMAAGDDSTNNVRDACPWERQLVEMADTVIDVVPLASGYSREAHGRLLFTPKASAAAVGAASTQVVYNYCLTDNEALAIRIVR